MDSYLSSEVPLPSPSVTVKVVSAKEQARMESLYCCHSPSVRMFSMHQSSREVPPTVCATSMYAPPRRTVLISS